MSETPIGCGGRHRSLALVMEQPLQSGRRAVEGHGKLLAHDCDRKVDARDPAQDAGYEIAVLEARGVAAMPHLIVRRPVDVVENRSRQPSPRESPKS